MAAPTVFSVNENTFTVYTHQKNIIGHGAYGVVYKGFDVNNIDFAAKCLTEVSDPETLIRTASVLRNLDHKNITKIYTLERMRNTFWVIMDYYPNGNLNKLFLQIPLTLDQKLDIMLDISHGLEYLHEQNLIHRNIKPQNILISNDSRTAKLIDFELSNALDPAVETAVVTSNVDTLAFKAPEYFLRSDHGKIDLTENGDIFSSGLVFLAMLQFKNNSRVLVPHIETILGNSARYILSIGQFMADRMVTKKLKLNVVHRKDDHSVAASIGAAVVTVASIVTGSVLVGINNCSVPSFATVTTSAIATAVAVGTSAISVATMFGPRAAAKLVALFVILYQFAFALCRIRSHSDICVRPMSGTVFEYDTSLPVITGVCSALTATGTTAVGYLIGMPFHEALASCRGYATLPSIVLASLGSVVGSVACFYDVQSKAVVPLKVALGALSGCLGAAAVRRVPLYVLAGAAALGAAIRTDKVINGVLLSGVAGAFGAGITRLLPFIISSVASGRQKRSSHLQTIAEVTTSSILAGVAAGLSIINFRTGLGVVGAAAGVTAGLGLAGHILPGVLTNAGDPFVDTDNDNGPNARKKRCELRSLIGQMTRFEPRQRPSASDVIKYLTIIRSLQN